MIYLTCIEKRLTLKSLRPLLTSDEELDYEIVNAYLSKLVCSIDRLGARLETVLFESAF